MNYHVTAKEFDDFKGFSPRRVLSVTKAFSAVQEWIGLYRQSKPSEIHQLGSHNGSAALPPPPPPYGACDVRMRGCAHYTDVHEDI